MVKLTGLSETVWNDRYALKDSEGNQVETTPEEMWSRVSKAIAQVEKEEDRAYWEAKFYELQEDFKFIPGGRINSGAGTDNSVSFYNCFVIPQPEDSRAGIMESVALMIEIMSRGGGVGVNLSSLRPRNSYVKSVNGKSSGPVNWGEMYSTGTGKVIQQGGTRRGALMIMLDDDHPDIEEFIMAKRIDKVTNKPVSLEFANVSVAVSDEFMEAVKNKGKWQTQFPTKANAKEGDEIKYGQEYDAEYLFNLICERAHGTAEPGLVFIDRYNKESNTWYYENIRTTNPCGEQGLPSWGVCNLGAINLSAYVRDGKFYDGDLFTDVGIATRFLDNVIDTTPYYFEENEAQQKFGTRRTGLGTMGLADALVKMGIRYGSQESLDFIDRAYSTIRDSAYAASIAIAKEKGSFPAFDKEKFLQGAFIQRLPQYIKEGIAEFGIRNGVLLTQAPTGTTSLLAGVSSGIEPIFSFKYMRKDRTGSHFVDHPLVEQWKKANPDQELPDYFVNSATLRAMEHVGVQARVQLYTDSSISKTVNAPENTTVAEVKSLYQAAFDMGCKGVTFYRDNSRDAVLTHVTAEPEKVIELNRVRPSTLSGYTSEITAPEGTAHVTVNSDDDGPREVFLTVGRAGSDLAAMSEAIGRLISLNLRMPSSMTPTERLRAIASQLIGIGGARSVGFGPNRVRSLADAVGQVLSKHKGNLENTIETKVDNKEEVKYTISIGGNLCPECNEMTLVFQEGCSKCISCGFAQC